MSAEQRIEQARRAASAQQRLKTAPPIDSGEMLRTEVERRIAAGILVDGETFAPAGADFLRIADLVGDYKTTPSAGGSIVDLWVGGRQFSLELRDIDAAAARLADYGEAVRGAAASALATGGEPAWPARPNLKTSR